MKNSLERAETTNDTTFTVRERARLRGPRVRCYPLESSSTSTGFPVIQQSYEKALTPIGLKPLKK